MTEKDDGGRAFPSEYYIEPSEHYQGGTRRFPGMSLRDYFAAAALQGQLSMHAHSFSPNDFLAPDIISRRAYQYADAMIAERNKP